MLSEFTTKQMEELQMHCREQGWNDALNTRVAHNLYQGEYLDRRKVREHDEMGRHDMFFWQFRITDGGRRALKGD